MVTGQDNAVDLAGFGNAQPLVPDVQCHPVRVTFERITVAATRTQAELEGVAAADDYTAALASEGSVLSAFMVQDELTGGARAAPGDAHQRELLADGQARAADRIR